jgi:hypothetical protein
MIHTTALADIRGERCEIMKFVRTCRDYIHGNLNGVCIDMKFETYLHN